ncbi:hypothetical protein EYF80_017696 [Liparis tanakae]|uniref:Uncharacterized protein n=1 Tax=Liparis tanakae TaxID=230148 RepID=A0A4Z2I209_9TELE|nr:hypothetical protein EYF80_017696 [Liparis tanakae]
MRMNPEVAEFLCTGPLSLKKAWCSTAHFHRCLQALGWSILKTKVCSCSLPWGGDRSMSDPGGQAARLVVNFSLGWHLTSDRKKGGREALTAEEQRLTPLSGSALPSYGNKPCELHASAISFPRPSPKATPLPAAV